MRRGFSEDDLRLGLLTSYMPCKSTTRRVVRLAAAVVCCYSYYWRFGTSATERLDYARNMSRIIAGTPSRPREPDGLEVGWIRVLGGAQGEKLPEFIVQSPPGSAAPPRRGLRTIQFGHQLGRRNGDRGDPALVRQPHDQKEKRGAATPGKSP